MDLKLRGRSVLITGATRGIGRGIAEVMAAEGCDLHISARTMDSLEAVARELRGRHGVMVACHAHEMNIPEEVEKLGHSCRDVDVLINNAGDIPTGRLTEIDSAAWRRGWESKVFGYIDLTRIILPQMYKRRSGNVVNVIGVAAEVPNPAYIAGCMGNAALNMFTHVLGGEAVEYGVRVNAVNPGPTMSDRHKSHLIERAVQRFGDADRWPEIMKDYPSGRSGSVEEVASLVAFLASDLSSNISGASVRVDGGIWAAARKKRS